MEDNIDINLLVQSFSERIAQLTNDNIVKDTVIKQLTARIEEITQAGTKPPVVSVAAAKTGEDTNG